MTLYRLTSDSFEKLPPTSFAERGVLERADLQRLLKANITVISSDVLVIAEEFGDWEDSRRRIDLLGIDSDASLVVIELKRDDTGGHMELQAIRYAAMVSNLTFTRAVEVFQAYLNKTEPGQDARRKLLDFLEWEEAREDEFGHDVRVILVAADFSKELTTSVLWLNDRDLDIRCARLKPYAMGNETIVDAQQIVPLPEAEEYMVKLREKASGRRGAVRQDTGFWFMNTGDSPNNTPEESRTWEDCKKYGFMVAGGGPKYIGFARRLKVRDKVFAYLSGHGYVGLGEVLAEAVPFKDFVPDGWSKSLLDLPLTAKVDHERMNNPDRCDWCAAVRWIHAVDRQDAILKERARRSTLERIRQPDLVAELLRHFSGSDTDG